MDDSPLFSPSTEKEIFLQALEIEDDEKRDAFLAKTCQGDEKLIERIRSLLGASESTGHFLDAEEFPAAKEELDVLAQDIEEESRFMEDLGTTIRRLGDYELIEELGRGAAGVVYRARQTSLNREVAIKVILGSSWTSAAGRRRFRAEAEAAASLNHRHIVPVYEINHAEGHDFYSMAYVRGGTLGDHLNLIHQDRRKAVTLMAKVARTVQVAHDHGILHRDLKPDNILLGEDGEPLISDFGLAFDLRRSDGLTLTGQILGTPQYMAPEQAWTHLGGITAQTDIYGLGAILFQLLSGRPVIEADNVMGAIQTLISEPALRLRSIDPGIHSDLETIVAKCLEKTPTDRYASARSLAEDLEAWLDRRSIAARAQTPTQRFFKWIQRKPVHAGLLASILLLLLSFGIGGPLFALRQASLREIAESAKAEALEAAELANRQANANRRLAYASNMRLINMAARFGTTPKMATQTMLKGLRPRDGGDDFRDWEWYYVYGKLHSAPIHIKHKPKGPINSLDFSPFGESLLVSSPKGTEVFDSVNRVMGRKFIDGEEHLFSAWNPDGRSILTLGKSGKVKLWNSKTAELESSLPEDVPARSVSWSPDGKRVAILHANNTIGIWTIEESFQLDEELVRPSAELEQVAWSPNGRYLAGIGKSDLVFAWDLDPEFSEDSLETFQGHNSHLTSIAWMPSGAWLATGSINGAVRIWGVPGGRRVANSGMNYGRGAVTALAWSPDEHVLLNTIDDWEGLLRLDFAMNDHTIYHDFEGVTSAMAWNAQSHAIAAGNEDGKVTIWREGLAAPSRVLWESDKTLNSIDWSQDDLILLCRDTSGKTTAVNVNSEDVAWSIENLSATAGSYARSPDGNQIAVISKYRNTFRIEIIDTINGQRLSLIDLETIMPLNMIWPKQGEILILSGNGGIVRLFPESDRAPEQLRPPQKNVALANPKISMSPDNHLILVSCENGNLQLLSASSGKVIFESPGEERLKPVVVSHAWHPNNTNFATLGNDGMISIWSASEKRVIRAFRAHSGETGSLAWHPDGNRLASGGESGDVFIWDWENGERLLELEGHADMIHDLAWDRAALRLASASRDGEVRLWDATAGVLLSLE